HGELDLAWCLVHVLQAFYHRADGDVARLIVGQVAGLDDPARVRGVGLGARVAGPGGMAGVPGPDDHVAAAPGYLDGGVACDGVDLAALGDRGELVRPVYGLAIHGEFLAVIEGDRDTVIGRGPGAGGVVEALRFGGQPVPAGDREEAVRMGPQFLVPLVPRGPVRLERAPVNVLDGHRDSVLARLPRTIQVWPGLFRARGSARADRGSA